MLRDEWTGQTVGAQDVSHEPGAFILAFSLWDANDLLELEGVAGGIYLYSNGRAYDDEQAADLDRLRSWVKHMGLALHGDPDDSASVPLHASGHARGHSCWSSCGRYIPRRSYLSTQNSPCGGLTS